MGGTPTSPGWCAMSIRVTSECHMTPSLAQRRNLALQGTPYIGVARGGVPAAPGRAHDRAGRPSAAHRDGHGQDVRTWCRREADGSCTYGWTTASCRVPKLCRGSGSGFHSSLVFVDEGAEDWPMLDPLAGAVGGVSSAIGAAWRRWPRRWPCCAGRSACFAVGRRVQLWPGLP
jgi:hypothetical protein